MRGFVVGLLFLGATCGATPDGVVRQVGYLRTILRQADDAYYNQHDSIMSDSAYDDLRARYDELVATHPELSKEEAVGAPVAGPEKIAHSTLVLSLQKAYTDEGVAAFVKKTAAPTYRIEPKIDGLTIVARYRAGALDRVLTRGNGVEGSDVTAEVIVSGCLPLQLSHAPDVLEVRGEVFMPMPAFAALNERRRVEGDAPLKSPRNTAAGTLRLDDFAEIERRGLKCHLFAVRSETDLPCSHHEALGMLQGLGLPVVEGERIESNRVVLAVARMRQRCRAFEYATDGVVIKVDDRTRYADLGATKKFPRGALARKVKTVPRETTVRAVEWKQGATGKWTPIALFEPVEVEGATIRRASLYNLDHLRALDLMIGDRVLVIRSGDSIPEIVGVRREKRTGQERPISGPPTAEDLRDTPKK